MPPRCARAADESRRRRHRGHRPIAADRRARGRGAAGARRRSPRSSPQSCSTRRARRPTPRPTIGSIGRVIELGREVVGEQTVPLVFAQPDFGRYTLHGMHFAAEGGIVYRLDRQPTMSTHPSTPMTEADLAVHFSHQTDLPIGSIPLTAYDERPRRIRIRGSGTRPSCSTLRIDEHLERDRPALSAARRAGVRDRLGRAEPRARRGRGRRGARRCPTRTDATGPVLAVSGSRSRADPTADGCRGRGGMARAAARAGGLARASAAGLGAVGPARRPQRRAHLGRRRHDRSGDGRCSRPSPRPRRRSSRQRRQPGRRGGSSCAAATRRAGSPGCSASSRCRSPPTRGATSCCSRAHAADPAVDGLELLLKGGQVGGDDLFVRHPRPGS